MYNLISRESAFIKSMSNMLTFEIVNKQYYDIVHDTRNER